MSAARIANFHGSITVAACASIKNSGTGVVQVLQGKGTVCGKPKFEKLTSLPTVDLTAVLWSDRLLTVRKGSQPSSPAT